MRILWLNANPLLPLDKGGKLRTWNLMRQLASRHQFTYLSFIEPDSPASIVRDMREVCARVETVPRQEVRKGTWAFYADVLRYLTNPAPYAVAKYRSPEYAARVRDLLATERFDLIVCDFLVPAVNMPDTLPCPAVLFTHNVESEIWRRHVLTASDPMRRLFLRGQWQRMLRFERDTLSRFGLVLAVSETDRATFQALYGPALRDRTFVVDTGVDTQYFEPGDGVEVPRHLVFTGSMDWLPNQDAMVHFVHDILPRIRREEPTVTLSIVGRDPTPAVRALTRHEGVEVTGRVDDVRPHVGRGAVYVVPLRVGGGTRLKIFEAMAMGKAVVSTTIGAEGLPVSAGRDIVIEDTPARFAAAVVEVLRNDVRRHSLGRHARALVVGRYDWSSVARDLDLALTGLVNGQASAREDLQTPVRARASERF